MKKLSRRIHKHGGHKVQPIYAETRCENCGSKKKYQANGLCVDCRRVLGLMNAPEFNAEDDDE
jgi:hypothetical protein